MGCINKWGSFWCEEPDIYEAVTSGEAVTSDEAVTSELTTLDHGMTSYKCPQGSTQDDYESNYESLVLTCVDIDECDNGEHDCALDEECINVWLSYECSTYDPFTSTTARTTAIGTTVTTAAATNEISDGILAGIIVPSIIFMFLIFLGIWFCHRRNQARKIMPERLHIQETSKRATSDYDEPYEDEMYTVPYANNIYAVYQV